MTSSLITERIGSLCFLSLFSLSLPFPCLELSQSTDLLLPTVSVSYCGFRVCFPLFPQFPSLPTRLRASRLSVAIVTAESHVSAAAAGNGEVAGSRRRDRSITTEESPPGVGATDQSPSRVTSRVTSRSLRTGSPAAVSEQGHSPAGERPALWVSGGRKAVVRVWAGGSHDRQSETSGSHDRQIPGVSLSARTPGQHSSADDTVTASGIDRQLPPSPAQRDRTRSRRVPSDDTIVSGGECTPRQSPLPFPTPPPRPPLHVRSRPAVAAVCPALHTELI